MKPSPFTLADNQRRVQEDRQALYADQEPLIGPITLEMCIARALKYNFDHRLAIMEAAFHDQELTAATYSMLPKLAFNAGYTHRDKETASTSVSYETRQVSLEPSISSEKIKKTGDITLTWTLLDFGLGYFQAKQQADRFLIMKERRRRVLNNITKEVISAYWKALTADKLAPQVDKALCDAQGALSAYEKIDKLGLSSPLEALEQQRDLLSIVSHLRRIQSDLAMSRVALAALVNLPLGKDFDVEPPRKHLLEPPSLILTLEELEDKGLALRPDLREEMYQERIDKAEVRKEILRMVPGVSLFGGYNKDNNKFLMYNEWSEVGARVTMGLFNLITGPMQIKAANTKVDITRTRRLAQTVAALVQINLSYYEYKQALEGYEYSKKISNVEKKIFAIAKSEQAQAAQSKLAFIRRSVNSVRAQIEHDRTLSGLYQFWGNMYFSLGGDIIPQDIEGGDLTEMAEMINKRIDLWWQGVLPFEEEGATN